MSERLPEGVVHEVVAAAQEMERNKEYTYEEGVAVATQQIADRAPEGEWFVVGVLSADPNVGKTYLSRELATRLREQDIPVIVLNNPDEGRMVRDAIADVSSSSEKRVFVVGQAQQYQDPSSPTDEHILGLMRMRLADGVGKQLGKQAYDYTISIYRPDNKKHVLEADVRICNEHAKDEGG